MLLLKLRKKITLAGDLAFLQFVFLGYLSTSSSSNRHSRDPILRWLGLRPDCRQYSKVLVSLSLSAGLIFSDIRAWVMLANWKSMSDVTNMCQYKVHVYQNQPQEQEQEWEQDRNRKIKFVFHFAIFIFYMMVSYCRKIWHISGDITANQHIYVFRNIIL